MLVSQAEYARQRGVSRQYVGQMVAKGIIGLSNRKVNTDQADAALAALREPARPERRPNPGTPVQVPSAPPSPALPTYAGDLPTLLLNHRCPVRAGWRGLRPLLCNPVNLFHRR